MFAGYARSTGTQIFSICLRISGMRGAEQARGFYHIWDKLCNIKITQNTVYILVWYFFRKGLVGCMYGQYAGLLPSCPEGPGLCLEPAINFSPNFERGAINWNCVIQLIIVSPGLAEQWLTNRSLSTTFSHGKVRWRIGERCQEGGKQQYLNWFLIQASGTVELSKYPLLSMLCNRHETFPRPDNSQTIN